MTIINNIIIIYYYVMYNCYSISIVKINNRWSTKCYLIKIFKFSKDGIGYMAIWLLV